MYKILWFIFIDPNLVLKQTAPPKGQNCDFLYQIWQEAINALCKFHCAKIATIAIHLKAIETSHLPHLWCSVSFFHIICCCYTTG